MKDAELVRAIIRLRSADRPADDVIAGLGKAELASQPEATIVAIVRGYYEFKSNGYEDADIYREIEGRREQAYGEEPLPADLNLDNYTRYRMRLEFPNQSALHDPIFVMQAVHRVRETLEKEYGPGGMPITFRTMPWVANAALAYAALVGVTQGGLLGLGIATGKEPPISMPFGVALLVVALALLAGAIGFAGKAPWGRTLLAAALAIQFAAHASSYVYMFMAHSGTPWEWPDAFVLALMAGHLAVIAGLLVFMHRPVRPEPAPA
ncbi:MAG: hypothetical protein KIS74_01225 [Burkholderiales bacterium]|nr:hypothetical protein [Burkholderiales bacterium]